MSLKAGRKRLLDAFEESDRKLPRSEVEKPLAGVVVCLTGLNSDKKDHLHRLVEKLGGSYTREFNLDKSTHLVAGIPQGAKYELATSHPRIKIVTPSWIEDCAKFGSHAEEAPHSLVGAKDAIATMSPSTTMSSYQHVFDILLKGKDMMMSLFEVHQFYLLGFEAAPEVRKQLGRAIRRGGGTIHWELSDDVTMLVLHDNCHEALRKAARVISNQHRNLPPAVSPRWIIDSLRRESLVSTTKYPPLKIHNDPITQKPASKPNRPSLACTNSTKTTTCTLRGALFALSRISPSTGAIDFDSKQQESLIKAHGGQMLTLKLMDAMRVDAKTGGQRRRCHVVCWGGAPRLDLNPILSQLQRYNICDLTLVTPVWLKTCISVQKFVLPSRLPEILVPQPWPFQDLKPMNLEVSVTGFTPTEKMALLHLTRACGISFSEDMTNSNTHLICKEKATGLKLEKASEWGLHIVSIKWLYYILQHGYHGESGSAKGGCEGRFMITTGDELD